MSNRVGPRSVMFVLAALFAASVQGQGDPAKGYPSKPIRIVVGFAAGGGTDIIARVVGQKLSEGLGQPVVVENRVGASGIIGAEFVAKSAPDGHTLLMSPSTVFVVNPIMFSKLPYSAVADFVPISTVVTFPLLLVVNASDPFRTVPELIAYLKSRPNKANFAGSAGIFQLALELFKLRAGVPVEYIPYKGTNESANAVLTGDALMAVVDAPPVAAMVKSGKVRVLAVTSGKRVSFFPDAPTLVESGFPDMEIQGWMAFFAPAGTPSPIARKLQEEVNRIVKLPEVRERIYAFQVEPAGNTSEELARMISSDITRWTAVAKASNIKPTN